MKTKSKALLLALCAAALVVATVFGTMAYLTSTATVENTFTVGSVNITLDEAPVNDMGVVQEGNRVQENAYKLIPGHTYTKDPKVHVKAGSENSWIFVKVENDLAAYEAAAEGEYKKIADQIIENGWEKLDGVADVYYKAYTGTDAQEIPVFGSFKIADDANTKQGWSNINDNTKIVVTAYAVQKDGFDSAKAAWDATFGE